MSIAHEVKVTYVVCGCRMIKKVRHDPSDIENRVFMLTGLICFFVGVFMAPIIRPLLRPFATEVMKLFITATYEVRSAAAKVKEEMEDAVAAAHAERAAKQRAAAEEVPAADTTKREP